MGMQDATKSVTIECTDCHKESNTRQYSILYTYTDIKHKIIRICIIAIYVRSNHTTGPLVFITSGLDDAICKTNQNITSDSRSILKSTNMMNILVLR